MVLVLLLLQIGAKDLTVEVALYIFFFGSVTLQGWSLYTKARCSSTYLPSVKYTLKQIGPFNKEKKMVIFVT